jgi:prepilin-type N-terminal cleavage/methylation domain-containing protein
MLMTPVRVSRFVPHSPIGFTLIELLVAMVLGGMLAGVVLQLLSGQSRFVDYQEARGEVQENTRSVRELIVGELRSVHPAGIEAAGLNSLTVRVPRVWGVVCEATATGAYLVTPSGLGTSYAVGAASRLPGLAVEASGGGSGGWTAWAVTAIEGGSGALAGCMDAAAGAAEIKRFTLTPTVPSPPLIAPGDAAYLYDRITYATGATSTASGLWIRRRIGTDDFQALAGPIASGSSEQIGLRFRYHSATAELSPATVTADPSQVRRIDMIVHSLSRARFAGQPQAEVDSTSVFLRSSG